MSSPLRSNNAFHPSALFPESHQDTVARHKRLICDVCDVPMAAAKLDYLYRCKACGLWRSTLTPGSTSDNAEQIVEGRTTGFQALRLHNYRLILDEIAAMRPLDGQSILEIGCAHGWFLAEAAARGAHVVGIESEPAVARRGQQAGLNIINGVFPDALTRETYDIVVFNDVFEHLPNPLQMLAHCASHMRPGGLLVLNLPSSEGFIFKTANWMRLRKIIARLWQVNFYTPHLYYFNIGNLSKLAERSKFRLMHCKRLKTIAPEGLWARIALAGGSPMSCAATYTVARSFSPVINRVLPPDTIVGIFENRS